MNQPSPFNKNANKSNVRSYSFGRQPVANQTGIKGKILEVGSPHQATKYNPNPNAPKTLDWWDEEKTRPKEQVMLLLQTGLDEGPTDDGVPDDGRRKIFVTVEYKPKGQMAAIMDAMAQVGAEDIEVGAELTLWFTGYDPESANPDNPRRLFQATYVRPAAAGGAFQAQQQPTGYEQAYGQPQQQQQPPQQQPSFAQANGGAGGFGAPPQQQQSSAPQYTDPNAALFSAGQQPAQQGFNPATGEVHDAPPAYQPPQPAAPQQGAPDVNQIRARLAAGQTVGQISAEMGVPVDTINAVRNLAAQPQQNTPPY